MIYEIRIDGYGGEIVAGKLTKEQYEFWVDKQDEEGMDSHLFWDPTSDEDGNPVTDDQDPRFLGNWYELDDIEHTNGANIEACTVTVEDEDGNVIYETDDPNISSTEVVDFDSMDSGYYFKGYSAEKGNFFVADLEADEFDPSKLKYFATNIEGDIIIDHVEYDGKDLDNEGGDTRGKSQGYEFYETV